MVGVSPIRCRAIGEHDLDDVAALLARGFPARPLGYWADALDTMRTRAAPDGCPRYGFMLDHDGRVVGAVLTIYQTITHAGPAFLRCNLSSWYVDPAFRSHAAMLSAVALRHRGTTFLNTSSAPNTRPIIEAQGFVRYSGGQLFTVPHPGLKVRGQRLDRFCAEAPGHAALPEAQLLATHQAAGCISLVGTGDDGARPFVLMPSRMIQGRLPIPAAQMVFARSLADVVRFAWSLGTILALRGRPVLIIDTDGPVPGLPGVFVRNRAPKYVRGPHPPRLGDLAFTEFPLFGA